MPKILIYMGKILQNSGKHLYLLIWKLYQQLNQTDHDNLRKTGFRSQTDFALLEILFHLGPQTIKALGDRIHLTSGSITTAIQRLEKQGFIHRRPNPNDRRQTFIHLAHRGRDSLEYALQEQARLLESSFRSLDGEERAHFARLCMKIENTPMT
ncbi:MAG: HTH-type transcriptional regulator MhqR [Opitutia bacterium UBA7350]|nr:MAG: HTH-type transcriptional regulator MhqR [Opitutae bacterium UBA7350]